MLVLLTCDDIILNGLSSPTMLARIINYFQINVFLRHVVWSCPCEKQLGQMLIKLTLIWDFYLKLQFPPSFITYYHALSP